MTQRVGGSWCRISQLNHILGIAFNFLLLGGDTAHKLNTQQDSPRRVHRYSTALGIPRLHVDSGNSLRGSQSIF